MVGEKKVALSVSYSWPISTRLRGRIALVFSVSFLRSVLEFHGVGTALMRTVDLYFIQRWTLALSDVCWAQRNSCESKTFVPFREIVTNSGGSVSSDTQRYCRKLFTIATALLSPPFFGLLLGCSSTFQCGNEHLSPNLQPDSGL